jgi:Fe2+ or Zn2+ uptake regulation protein
MSQTDTAEQIIRELRRTEKPAMSAAQLSENIDVSVHTINNHLDTLLDQQQIQDTQIGNATAYFIESESEKGHGTPNHYCVRCGRGVYGISDYAKIEERLYFHKGGGHYNETDFYIFCRFCYSDFVSWIYDPAAMEEYPFLEHWDLPDHQREEAKSNPNLDTEPYEE